MVLNAAEWQARYEIVSISGRIWTRAMVAKLAGDQLRAMSLAAAKERRAALDAVMDDDTFMRPMRGSVPAYVARQVAFKALVRLSGDR